MSYMFDIEKAIKDSSLSKTEIRKIQDEVRQEFPHDEMMYELHLLRALESVKYQPHNRQAKVLH